MREQPENHEEPPRQQPQGHEEHSHTESAPKRPSRPVYLVIALVVAWFLGLGTFNEGYMLASIARDPLAGDSLNVPPAVRDTVVDTIVGASQIALPLGIAQILLGALLIVVSAATLFGGRMPLSFTLQVLAANVVLAVVAYFLAAPIRESLLQALLATPEFKAEAEAAGGLPPEQLYPWFRRLNLLFHVGALSLAGLALTRPAVRAFLAHSAASRQKS